MSDVTHSPAAEQLRLRQAAQAHFNAGRYREAAESYQTLSQQSNDSADCRQLGLCHWHLALAVASQDRYAEAAEHWGLYAKYVSPPHDGLDRYLLWLLLAGNWPKAYAALQRFAAEDLDGNHPQLGQQLGYLLLAGRADMAEYLPAGCALQRDWPAANQALAAYRADDAAACRQALQALPFNSPFRDFRLLLSAQLLSGTEPRQAQTWLEKISPASPYHAAANAARVYLQSGADFAYAAAKLAPQHRQVLNQSLKLSAGQVALLETLSRQGDSASDREGFELALQYRSLFGNEDAQAYCQGMLAHYPDGYADYLNYFAVKEPFQQSRLQALLCEKGRHSREALQHWRRCVELLQDDVSANAGKIGLLLQHMAGLAEAEEQVELLAESLEYRPAEKAVYLQILRFYSQTRPNKAAYADWLQRGLLDFAGDADLLAHALAAGDGKQTLAYAQALLEVDPKHVGARQALFADAIRQARHLLGSGQWPEAQLALQAAAESAGDRGRLAEVDLLRGFGLYRYAEQEQGLSVIRQALARLHDDEFTGSLRVRLEAAVLKQVNPLPAVLAERKLSAEQLGKLLALLESYVGLLSDHSLLRQVFDEIEPAFFKVLQNSAADPSLLLVACRLLAAIGHYDALQRCVALADEQRQLPVWQYYQTLADCRGDAGRLDYMTLFQLQNALSEAHALHDGKTALLLTELIERQQIASNPFAFHDELAQAEQTEPDQALEDLYEALFGHLPAELLARLEDKVQELLLESDPEQFAEQYRRQYAVSVDAEQVAELSEHPDFFACVVLLAAAEALQADVGVDFLGVVAKFRRTLL